MEQALYFSKEHEWVRVEGKTGYVGITDHAQNALGDLVYVDCGEIGLTVAAGDPVAVVESVKAASDVYAPVSGTVCGVNEALAEAPERINEAPYENFIFALTLSDPEELDALMSEAGYLAFLEE